ncbi:hypothetical protein SUDANB58_05921 (plasmid) [Streptomyces sp. enrichment culture]|uniref:hypothetical protein n=1 Tax=Streptomyces sp. enrichment culture TaxID=1795815 RepID=UPI003F5787E3
MSTTTARPATGSAPEPLATDRARRRVAALLADLRHGAWSPTPLEVRVAALLSVSTAGDGVLTSLRVRAALWEGSLAMTRAGGGRFARALAGLVPVLDDPRLAAPDVLDAAGELVDAVAAVPVSPCCRHAAEVTGGAAS